MRGHNEFPRGVAIQELITRNSQMTKAGDSDSRKTTKTFYLIFFELVDFIKLSNCGRINPAKAADPETLK